MITEKQVKVIWTVGRQLGMDSARLHEFVSGITGKDSIKALSVSEAAEVIGSLVEAGAKIKKKRKPRRDLPPNVVELVTCEQMRFIKYLENKLGWQDNPERLKGFFKRIIKREGVRTKQEGIKVIQGLKSMVDRKAGKEVNHIDSHKKKEPLPRIAARQRLLRVIENQLDLGYK